MEEMATQEAVTMVSTMEEWLEVSVEFELII